MNPNFSRRSLLVLAPMLLGSLTGPALACRSYDGFDPKEPFSNYYLEHFKTIFRGYPVEFRLLADNSNGSPRAAEITFDVVEWYDGQKNETVTAFWFVDPFLMPRNLDALKRQVGDDLVVVLGEPDRYSLEFSPRLPIAYDSCYEPAMRSYAVMEPVLRSRGLID